MRISEFSKQSGLTKRTLQYYDEINILVPDKKNNGYREYDLYHLQIAETIKFLRSLEYSLEEIRAMLDTTLNKEELIDLQINYYKERIIQLKKMKAGEYMSIHDKYKKEVEERWGHTDAYKEQQEKTKNYTKADYDRIQQEQNEMFKRIADTDIETSEMKNLINEWQQYITDHFYTCNDDIMLGLADMYVEDHRFEKNLNKIKDGFAKHFSDAIKYHKTK